jgi:hypothetical protein
LSISFSFKLLLLAVADYTFISYSISILGSFLL